ncbi:Os01g0147166 [Oryza sativa Japonica Group]|uniref:Os01g0147166 protein n=1 Tax=Oryza sativa subsp. japonica TaxID=39947 RepID=A0A0P0UYH5_ORYSJ|nr:Os01g0147166 [Oryza sativa Japonica Group]
MEHGIEMTAQCDNSRGLEPPPRLDMSLKVSNFFTKAKESNISDREAIAIMGTIDLTAAAVSFGCMGVKFNEEDHGDVGAGGISVRGQHCNGALIVLSISMGM